MRNISLLKISEQTMGKYCKNEENWELTLKLIMIP